MKRYPLFLLTVLLPILVILACADPQQTVNPAPSPKSVNPVATDLLISGQTAGDNLYFNGSHWARRVSGTSTGNSVRVDTAANRPTATGSGLIFFPTDLQAHYVDDPNGGVWRQFFRGQYTPAPATAASYTLVGSSTGLALTQMADAIRVQTMTTAVAKSEVALLSGSLGNTSTWIVNFVGTLSPLFANYQGFGPIVTNGTTASSSTGYSVYQFYGVNGAASGYAADTVTLDIGRSASTAINANTPEVVRMRLLADGTNLHEQAALMDPTFWYDIIAQTTPSGLTNYGFMMACDFSSSTTTALSGTVYRNDLTTLTVAQATITGITAASPAVVATSAAHNFVSGDVVAVHGVVGTSTFASTVNNGTTATALGAVGDYGWVIKVTDGTHFQLIGSNSGTGGAYSSGGNATLVSR